MKRLTGLVLGGMLLSAILISMPYYALELHGGSKIYATDPPVRKGRLLLFHRYPDGAYMSLAASEVERVVATEEPPPRSEKLAPGETVFIGSPVEGPSRQPPAYLSPSDPSPGMDYGSGGYGYSGWVWGGYVPPPRPPGPAPFVPSNIAPNGFPILAPPGSPGSAPPSIGSNGFPILAPQPPVAPNPRRP